MESGSEPSFSAVDYTTFAAVLLVSVAIGIYTALRGNKSPEDFLMGSRSFGPIPVAMSLLTSFVSAISLLGYTGEAYAYGIQMYLFIVGIACGIGVSAVITLPVIYPLKLTSINEYIILRFDSSRLRDAILGITCVQCILYLGVCLYAPTIALSTVTPLSSLAYIFILGGVVTVYSTIGGIRAVVWTDVFQLIIMVLGIVVVFVAGICQIGPSQVWAKALEGGRLTSFDLDLSIYKRHNVFNTFFFGLFLFAANYGTSQINVQRLCSVQTLKDAKLILFLNAVGMIVLFIMIFGEGVIAYAVYFECDPWKAGFIQKKEEIMPFFIVDRLSFITGLPGIFVATIIGGALSSLSSTLNAVVAMIWQDFCMNLKPLKNVKPNTAGIINKLITLLVGGVTIGMALVAGRATDLIQFSLSVGGAMLGGIFGVFLLGFLFPRTNIKGVWTGLIVSNLFVSWISIGAYFYGESTPTLPFSVSNCSYINYQSGRFEEELWILDLEEDQSEANEANSFALMNLYGISYTLYPIIGTTSCVVVAILVSLLTGNEDLKKVNPLHVTPFMRKFYWTEEELLPVEEPTFTFRSNDQKEKKSPRQDVTPLSFTNIDENWHT